MGWSMSISRENLQQRQRRRNRSTVSARIQEQQERMSSIRKPEHRKDSRVARQVEGTVIEVSEVRSEA